MHAAGWLEGGLTASFEKFVLDIEMLQMIMVYLEPLDVSPGALDLAEIAEVGPGGLYFGTAQTIAGYEHAFYSPLISTTRNYGAWQEDGGLDATRRAHVLYKRALTEYTEPAMLPERREALDAFVAKRKAEGGAPLD
jgi:trimethylamine--corrinoid protein Co-methyltransferase